MKSPSKNAKITVTSTDSRRDGYVSHKGLFLRENLDVKGEAYAWEYLHNGMVGTAFVDRTVFRLGWG